ncbi:MAG: 50S ribosomal protein L24 [Candidatus Pacebacteria bacterium]|jgi:large subunit ribosomal protein L24|nr:50S ribosomal protein L24 [Candidatus Paceibacterota bacterium]MBT3511522.1 50S ribosomal protein L24 [Candidatus Paceibacterota bacterium]MBT4005008.1 50S ribosomal protein L24 [Candidatus Paceibacterota bacterium]MBT4358784.1 50S ribosomal protein L24 [Candidatus Paceibacterota bacterium]MBT4680592.1 50S ribosomal protein L24 [Candidatus Paceibacterota bacterium]
MKFKVGDKVLVTSGKDKGQKEEIVKVFPTQDKVIVKGANMYSKHIKPIGDKPGDKVRRERPMSVAKIAILNDKGEVDRIGYKVAKDGSKERIFKKTGQPVPALDKKKLKK